MSLTEFIGQERIKRLIHGELRTGKTFRHTLIYGPGGLGKTTLARAIAQETGYTFIPFSAGKGWRADRVISMLLSLDVTGYAQNGIYRAGNPRYLIYMDEVHLLPDYEAWYIPLEEFNVYHGGNVSWLPDFTFVGSTTDIQLLPASFRDRCPNHYRLDWYSDQELIQMIEARYCKAPEIAEIAKRARGVPRIALNYAESCAGYEHPREYFALVGIDERGLTELDWKVLHALASVDRPISLNTLAAITGESPAAISEFVEPYLLRLGLMDITPRGRVSTISVKSGRGEKGV